MSTDKNRKKPSVIKNFIYMLKIIGKADPKRIWIQLCQYAMHYGLRLFFNVVLLQYVLGKNEPRTFTQSALFIAATLVISTAVFVFLSWIYNIGIPKSDIRISKELNKELFIKAAEVDIACYETPEFYDNYSKAVSEAATRGAQVVQDFAMFVCSLVSTVIGLIMMARITVWCLPFVIVPAVAHLFISPRAKKYAYELNNENTPYRRRSDYVNRTVFLKRYTGEMRMTGIFGVLKNLLGFSFNGINKNIDKYKFKLMWYHWIGCFMAYVFALYGMWIVAGYLSLVDGSIRLGQFAVLASAISTVSDILGYIGEAVRQSAEDGIFIENFKKFMAYKPQIPESWDGSTPPLPVKSLTFKNVSFKYPNTENYALENINFTVKSGEKTAIVGFNGSGKTTLIKLIMRFYDPTDGEILLNGINIKSFNLKAYRRIIGATFQDFAIFSSTVTENVLLREPKNDSDKARAAQALRNSGIAEKIRTLPKGADTVLTREFDENGACLSGGEEQKIAVARAFASQRPIIILDEPSSALDPIAEYNLYENILKVCSECDPEKGKIAFIISHRLSSAALSDNILLLSGGKLVQKGTHRELMDQGGEYADMFNKQAESYMAEEGGVQYA